MKLSRHASMFIILCFMALGGLSAPAWALPANQDSIILGIDPMTQAVSIDSEFLVVVYINSVQEPIDGVQVTLAFDPAYLSVVELLPDDALPDVFPAPTALPDGYSNSEGRISFAAGKLGANLPSGQFAVLTIRFHAEDLTTGTLVEFIDDPNLVSSKVTHGGINLGINLIPSVIAIVPSGEPTSTEEPTATASPTSTSTETPIPTETPVPTDTPVAPEPTSTGGAYPWQEGTATPTPVLTETPTETPTLSPTSPSEIAPATATLPSRRDETPASTPGATLPSASPTATSEAIGPTATAPQEIPPPLTSTPAPTATPGSETAATSPPPTVPGETMAPSPAAPAVPEGGEDVIGQPEDGVPLWTSLLTDHIWSTMGIFAIVLFSMGFAILRRQWVATEDGEKDEREE